MSRRKPTSRWVTLAVVAFAIAILAALVVPAINVYPIRDERTSEILEAYTLSQATTAFQLNFGYKPPQTEYQIRRHLHAVSPHATLNSDDLDAVIALDDAERLVFWLGGDTLPASISFDRTVFFEFDPSLFVDQDSDGFREYRSRRDKVFSYDSTTSRVSCDFSDDEMVAKIDASGIRNDSSTAIPDDGG
ncbi:hypothetical protein CA13_09800 [Planctomycetes bacterium CA13]|uniref:Uncharacterized protein n=1 Tax=Novipirellula herctigrandis TaxID=2527986 RepID=A0A5C5YXT2_9BACT|nr:hypothetical protein CA13_09800 [Planctomycetes bacterium CA13]